MQALPLDVTSILLLTIVPIFSCRAEKLEAKTDVNPHSQTETIVFEQKNPPVLNICSLFECVDIVSRNFLQSGLFTCFVHYGCRPGQKFMKFQFKLCQLHSTCFEITTL